VGKEATEETSNVVKGKKKTRKREKKSATDRS